MTADIAAHNVVYTGSISKKSNSNKVFQPMQSGSTNSSN